MKREPKEKKPKSKTKKIFNAIVIVLTIFVVGLLVAFPAWRFFWAGASPFAHVPEIAKRLDNVDYDKDSGVTYVNDEIIVMTAAGATHSEVRALAREFDAEIVTAMEDIGIWQFRLDDKMTYEELNKTVKKIKRNALVEDAYINPATEANGNAEIPAVSPASSVSRVSNRVLTFRSSISGMDISRRVSFTDESFIAGGYKEDLVWTGLMLSQTAYDKERVKANLETLGFERTYIFQYYYEYNRDEDLMDWVAYTFATKTVIVEEKSYDLIAIVIRGTAIDAEWASNFLAQEAGFGAAVSRLESDLADYITFWGKGERTADTKVFITGHSRGAAVANILAAHLSDNDWGYRSRFEQDNIMAYTFATPNTVENDSANGYYNIVNICNPVDSVTGMPNEITSVVTGGSRAMWKNGLTFVFPAEGKVFSGKTDNSASYIGKMKTSFAAATGLSYDSAKESAKSGFDHNLEVYYAWLDSTEPTHIEYRKGKYIESHIGLADNSGDSDTIELYPNDPWANDAVLWNTNAPQGSNWGVEAIHAPAAWSRLSDLAEVGIGFIDYAPNRNHDDLTFEKLIINETSLDTNDSGYGAERLLDPNEYENPNHGSHVAGIMGASWDNGEGVSGVTGGKGKLYYAQSSIITEDGAMVYTAMDYITSIESLVNSGVKAINISMGFDDLICYAASKGNAKAQNLVKMNAQIIGSALKRFIAGGNEFVLCVSAGNSNNKIFYKNDGEDYGYSKDYFWPWELFGMGWGSVDAKYGSPFTAIEDETVKSRIIVVGSVGRDSKKSSGSETRYKYSGFSNIGSRVDICAPGEDIYSAYANGYGYMSGTSMAAPHVTGVAGLVFAANPELSGADVKKIILASVDGRFYYENGFSGMVSASAAVGSAVETRAHSVNRVIKTDADDGLDLCFVVDTTASMHDDIDDAKQNMSRILDGLFAKSENARVAIVAYQDFKERNPNIPEIEPSRLYLDFSGDKQGIQNAVNDITILQTGNCDTPEAVFSGIMRAVSLDWRPYAKKVIIVMGDAEPLEPEPITGYTFNDCLAALYDADVSIDVGQSDYRVFDSTADSLIKVYSIDIDTSGVAKAFFESIAEKTGGAYTDISSANEVSSAIANSIEKIELKPARTVTAPFGPEFSGETIELFQNGRFVFEVGLDENGEVKLERMELDRYDFSITRLMASGRVRINESGKQAKVSFDESPWYSFAVALWQRERVRVISYGAVGLIAIVTALTLIFKIKKRIKRRKIQTADAPLPSDTKKERAAASVDDNTGETSAETLKHEPVLLVEQSDELNNEAGIESADRTPLTTFVCPNCGAKYVKPVKFCGNCGGAM